VAGTAGKEEMLADLAIHWFSPQSLSSSEGVRGMESERESWKFLDDADHVEEKSEERR
jgi:hypothetical protein